MRISVHAVGRMKSGPEKELADRYFSRFAKSGPAIGLEFLGITEAVESRAQSASERQREEAVKFRSQMAAGSVLFLLDERGVNISSDELSSRIAALRDGAARNLVIAIGGPDGHDADLRKSASFVLSFGALTWPHQIVRVMLAEQLYRVSTILSGHPYHRV